MQENHIFIESGAEDIHFLQQRIQIAVLEPFLFHVWYAGAAIIVPVSAKLTVAAAHKGSTGAQAQNSHLYPS